MKPHISDAAGTDRVSQTLHSIAQYTLLAISGVLPLLFIPGAPIAVGSIKVFIACVAVFLSLIFFALATLRAGSIVIGVPWALAALWGVVGAAVISGLLSNDIRDAFVGNFFETGTVGFLVLLALLTSLITFVLRSKADIMRLYSVLTVVTVVLSVYHLLRVVVGPDVLSFGVFEGSVASPVGGWNDLGLLFGFVVLLIMVAVEQLPLTKWGRLFVVGILAISLVMLAIINFSAVWVVLGVCSLVQLMYGLTKEHFQPQTMSLTPGQKQSPLSVVVSAVVFIVATIFVVGGTFVGGLVSDLTGISYVEVRPSAAATLDIGQDVYGESAVTGVGPNQFSAAWQLHKDRSINDTVFWNTDFVAGNGYLTTQFVNLGLLGGVAWIVFMGLLLFTGARMLFRPVHVDKFWYYIGTSSFVASVYLWGMFFIYVPGPALLLLAAVSTGIVCVAYGALVPESVRTVRLATDRRSGFALIAVVMLLIIISVGSLYWVGRIFYAEYTFAHIVRNAAPQQNIETIEQRISELYALHPNDRYAQQLGQLQLARLNALLALEEPTAEQQQQFQDAVANGVQAAQQAIRLDSTEPQHYALLGSIYSVLATAQVENAQQRAEEAFATARQYDPMNPEYALLEAQLAARLGDVETARTKVEEAISLKQNYTDALFFISQLEIAEGNTQAAIEATQAMISLEPRNAARYYQLGVLQSATGALEEAIAAFERAVALDNDYANARYFLALAYLENDQIEAAREQLEVVAELNPDNVAPVEQLLQQIDDGTIDDIDTPTDLIPEPSAQIETDGETVTSPEGEAPESDMLTPVNTPAGAAADSAPESAAPTSTATEDTTALPESAATSAPAE